MTDRAGGRASSRAEWAAGIADLDAPASGRRAGKPPITVDRILETAFRLIRADGFEALTMRRVAAALDTGPASLYAHVRNKAALDDLLIGAVSRRIDLPEPDPASWRAQFTDVCRRLRDRYLEYPGISRAALAAMPHSLDTLRLQEGMLAILLAGGVAPRTAAWTIDAATLYVAAYSLEASLREHPVDDRVVDRDELRERFRMLPADRFPLTLAHLDDLTAGEGHDRFDFALDALLPRAE